MEEPSVLDYVKSKLRLRQSNKIDLPLVDNSPEPGRKSLDNNRKIPWKSLLALALALAGQRNFEASSRNWEVGVAFFLVSAVFLIWAVLRSEWSLAPIRAAEIRLDPLSLRLSALLPAVIFALAAFALFGGNLFNALNLTIWFLAIMFLCWGIWLRDPLKSSVWEQFGKLLKHAGWQINISRWNLLVLAAIVLVVFFRTYQLTAIPAEPISDHAEKIFDIYDITQGQTLIFFPRNTGREGFQMYLTLAVAGLFGTGLSFLSLKIGTVLCGLATLPYMYFLGKEIANRRVGLLAMVFTGIAYWPNVISRFGLRFPLYPLFVAPVLYYLIRGLRRSSRNDFILAGFFLGLGLHGYSSFRIVPIMVVVAIGLYLVHRQSSGSRKQALVWLGFLTITSLIVFLPLLRYWIQNPENFSYRAISRLGSIEQPLPGIWWQILLSNTWNALKMVNWSNGNVWAHSIPFRPALDLVSAVLFFLGVILILLRYLRQKNWQDLFLILSIPLLMLPSILSLAFPNENPALNRTAGAYVPIFIIVALALDGLLEGILSVMGRKIGRYVTLGVTGLLLVLSVSQNYDLVFNQYNQQFRLNSWNSSEMGQVIEEFGLIYGSTDNAWVVGYPYWVDGRLVGIWAGIPNREFGIMPENLSETQIKPGAKLFIYNMADINAASFLKNLYPQGSVIHYTSKIPNHDFMIFFEPSQ